MLIMGHPHHLWWKTAQHEGHVKGDAGRELKVTEGLPAARRPPGSPLWAPAQGMKQIWKGPAHRLPGGGWHRQHRGRESWPPKPHGLPHFVFNGVFTCLFKIIFRAYSLTYCSCKQCFAHAVLLNLLFQGKRGKSKHNSPIPGVPQVLLALNNHRVSRPSWRHSYVTPTHVLRDHKGLKGGSFQKICSRHIAWSQPSEVPVLAGWSGEEVREAGQYREA